MGIRAYEQTIPGITHVLTDQANKTGENGQAKNTRESRPRVLLIGTHLPPDLGSRSVAEGLATRLRERGFVVALTSRRRSRALRVADMLVTIWTARGTYDVAQVDVYSGAAFRWAEWVVGLLHALRKPLVLTLRGGNLPNFARQQPRRVDRLVSRATAVTAPSQYLADAMRNVRSDVQIIPNPIEVGSYTYTERHSPKPRLIWLRAFHRIYNPVLAVRVLARVASEIDEARLTMVGADKDGSLAKVRAEAEQLGVLDRITFTGGVPKSDVPRWLATADIFLNTTTIDNTPVSVLEAMATGLLVVSTAVGGIPYLLEDEQDSILVPSDDVEKMAQAVKRLLNEPVLAARVSRNARAKSETFGWDSVLPQWEELLTDVSGLKSSRNERRTS
jgi:glycosyltransferase involved in cell wall biosynthesis